MNLANCPWCGGNDVQQFASSGGYVNCNNEDCRAFGPEGDPTGSKWNALAARVMPERHVAVPESEIEALRDALCDAGIKTHRPNNTLWPPIERAFVCADRITARLPAKVDHVARLKLWRSTWTDNGGQWPRGGLRHDVIETIDAAIAAIEKMRGGK